MNKKNNILFRPWKKLKRLQNEKLRFFITRHLYPFSRYYRELFDKNKIKPSAIRTVEDLQKLPFTSKKDFITLIKRSPDRSNFAFLLEPNEELIRKFLPKSELLKFFLLGLFKGKASLKASLDKEYRPIFLTATAGTTNQPIPFLYTSYDLDNLKICGKRVIEIMGINKEQRAMNVFPYAPHLAFWQTVFAGFAANIFIISTGGGKTVGTKGNIRTLLKVKPRFLIGTPSYVYHILKTARERNLNLSFLNRIILGAARVPKGFKLKISKLLTQMGAQEIRVFGTYGFTESRCAWVECPADIGAASGYHTFPDKEVFEVIDPLTGQVKGEGQDGELVYTKIDGRGSCVLRYRTGDIVKGGIVYSPCPHCGRTVPRISNDIVRAANVKNIQLSKIKGTVVNLNTLEYILDNNEAIDDWQIEIMKKDNDPYEVDELILNVSLLGGVNKDEFISSLNQEVSASAEVSFNRVNFVSSLEIQQMLEVESAVKAKRIVDKRGKISNT
ncbi:MAG: AMP-binding protein [Omnitrophica bacterium]|nr:AMP-binding protein [Candidatus Omnitrophota bacterium]